MRTTLIKLLQGYRAWVSPLLGAHCRFHPSCSAYALEAIEIHGAPKGLVLTLHRLARCQPWCAGGVDSVPRPMIDKPL